MRVYIIIGFLVFMNLTCFSTVDYLCANSITKELYWADDDNPSGFIGWEYLPENYESIEKNFLNRGYTYTTFPFKLELVLLLIFIAFYMVFLKTRKWVFRRA